MCIYTLYIHSTFIVMNCENTSGSHRQSSREIRTTREIINPFGATVPDMTRPGTGVQPSRRSPREDQTSVMAARGGAGRRGRQLYLYLRGASKQPARTRRQAGRQHSARHMVWCRCTWPARLLACTRPYAAAAAHVQTGAYPVPRGGSRGS